VRGLNRLELVGETVRATLNSLAVAAPQWLKEQIQAEWIERYEHRIEDYRLPDGKQAREAYALVIGQDGITLLNAIDAPSAPTWVRLIPAVQTLRHVWIQHFFWQEGELRWRSADNIPAAGDCFNSPYDPEAKYAKKRDMGWVGYKVHLTETCDDDLPHVITHVETTPAPLADLAALPHIHEALEQHDLLPQRHLVDTGYVDAEALVKSQHDYGVDLFGPTRDDYHWQAREGTGFAAEHFVVDWECECAVCPAGKTSSSWSPVQDRRGHPVVKIKFAVQDCGPCPHRQACTKAQTTSPRRTLTVRPQERYQALQAARQRQALPEFTTQYNQRAGIEGTLSQGVRAFGLRQARYRGLEKVHLQHVLTATALNLSRLHAWLSGQSRAHTRQSAFVRLAKQ
jgi:transposase